MMKTRFLNLGMLVSVHKGQPYFSLYTGVLRKRREQG